MDAALNILRKTPPSELESTLAGLQTLVGTHDAETIEAIRQRLQLPFGINDKAKEEDDDEKSFLLCPYNKIKEGVYRSPWTNVCWPGKAEVELSTKEQEIRRMEDAANEVWEAYTHLYYGLEAVGSVYLQKVDKGVYQGMFGIRKDCPTGSWNSAHLVVVEQPNADQTECTYHVQSTVVISLDTGASEVENKEFTEDHTTSHHDDSMPIADLHPNCTVFFADIAGFTKWSDGRSPEEVFKLLETIYAAFDRIARKRKVFSKCFTRILRYATSSLLVVSRANLVLLVCAHRNRNDRRLLRCRDWVAAGTR